MAVFTRQIALAKKVIGAKGELCKWRSAQAPVAQDDSKPWIQTQSEPTETSVRIVFTKPRSPFISLGDGDQLASALCGLMAAVAFIPSVDDTVVRSDGSKLQIKSMDKVAPNGEVIIWKMEFKG